MTLHNKTFIRQKQEKMSPPLFELSFEESYTLPSCPSLTSFLFTCRLPSAAPLLPLPTTRCPCILNTLEASLHATRKED